MSCSWKVPETPLSEFGSNAPGWWFGV